MGPKKVADTKNKIAVTHPFTDQVQEQAAVTYPTNECNFVVQFDLKQEAGHQLKIRFDWLTLSGEDFEMKDIDTPSFKEWTLLQVEGEDPVPVEQVVVVDPKAAGKKAPAKPVGKAVVEEVIDNRPRTIQFKRDFAAENGDQGFKFTEPVALKFSKTLMNVCILENDQVVERIQLDLSSLLFPQDNVEVRLFYLLNYAVCMSVR